MELIQVAQRAEDLSRAVTFYERLTGHRCAAVFEPPGLAFFHLGATRLLLDTNAPSALLYLGVDDVSVTIESLRAEGVVIESEPHVIFRHDDDTLGPAATDEWMAFFRDSEGNTVGLVSRSPVD